MRHCGIDAEELNSTSISPVIDDPFLSACMCLCLAFLSDAFQSPLPEHPYFNLHASCTSHFRELEAQVFVDPKLHILRQSLFPLLYDSVFQEVHGSLGLVIEKKKLWSSTICSALSIVSSLLFRNFENLTFHETLWH